MERNWDLSERTDGRLYTKNDMVKVGCNDCKGCSACCHGMGESIVLDPYDIYRMASGLHVTMEELMAQSVELHVVDGVILPNLKMQGAEEACGYLDEQGRCTIHAFRPGICRLFPLGRLYEEDGFRYFLQVHECQAQQKTKVKIKQWLDTPDLNQYETFILEWHDFLKEYQTQIKKGLLQGEELRQQNLRILTVFYFTPYQPDQDFYRQFKARKALF